MYRTICLKTGHSTHLQNAEEFMQYWGMYYFNHVHVVGNENVKYARTVIK